MDDRLREFGGVPGYEFDVPRAYGRPGPVVGGGGPPRQTWPQEPAGNPAWPVRSQLPQDDPSAGPGRPTLLARETLAAMRARNWLTSLAAPVLAAVAVGVAGVLLLGANNGGDAAAPSALAAGFPPAQSAAARFRRRRPSGRGVRDRGGRGDRGRRGQRESRLRAVGLG